MPSALDQPLLSIQRLLSIQPSVSFNVVSTISFAPPSVHCCFYHQFRSPIRTISFAPTSLVFPYTLSQLHFQCRSAISFAPTSSIFTSTIGLNSVSTKLHVDSTISLAPTICFAPTFRGLPIHHRSQPCLNSAFNVASTISFAPTSSVLTYTIGLNPVSTPLSTSLPPSDYRFLTERQRMSVDSSQSGAGDNRLLQ